MNRTFAGLLLGTATALLVASCGSNAKTEDIRSKSGPVTISYWSWVPVTKQSQAVVNAIQEKYPDIKVEYWRAEFPDYEKKIQAALAAGEGPDLFGVQTGAMLGQYARFALDVKPYADKFWGAGWQNRLNPRAISETQGPDGEQSALPISFSAQQFVLYNKALFDQVGITNVPKTYADWKVAVDKLRAAGVIPVVFGGKDVQSCLDVYIALANQFAPGKIYKAQEGSISWNDPDLINAANAWRALFTDKIFQDGALGLSTYPEARDQYFYARKAAMFMIGSWNVGSFALPGGEKDDSAIKNDATGAFLLPQIGPNPSRAITGVDTALSINRATKHQDAAWRVFSFMTMDEGQQIMADFMQGTPSRRDVVVNTVNQLRFSSEKDAYVTTIREAEKAVGSRFIKYPDLRDALGAALQQIALGGKSVTDAMADVQRVSDRTDRG